ncbi:MAG TPA: porin [Gemmata sp.]
MTPINLNVPEIARPPAGAGAPPAEPVGHPEPGGPGLYDSLHDTEPAGLKSLFDSFHTPSDGPSGHWYDKLTIRGYSQFRFGRAVTYDSQSGAPSLLGDRSISETTGTFSIRRARLILAEDVSDHLRLYFQSDFANNPADREPNADFAQIRDLYADIFIDTAQVHRFRVGQSKIPWGFEEMQSSGNRVPLDRSDALDSGDSPNQRDLGVFYYWTPVDKQQLLKRLVDGGLKGTGNYGIFALGVYNGQGGSQLDQNRSVHTLARFTWPFQLPSGQVVEVSLQGYVGKYVVNGTPVQPLGVGPAVTPVGVGPAGLQEERLAATFVWYPQPFGFQTEWNVGSGPGLNDAQTAVQRRPLEGGYAMVMYKRDTANYGIFIPYGRYQHYRGGYRSISNAPYGTHDEYDVGVEWQVRKELELVVEYGFVNGVSLEPSRDPGVPSYQNFHGQVLRCQMQVNY